MALTIDEQIAELNELIRIDFDAVGSYEAALDDIEQNVVRDPLIRFRGDHERHVQNLSQLVVRLGGKPADASDLESLVRKTMTTVAAIGGTELTLKAMKATEELLNKSYAHRLTLDLPDDIKQIIRANYADEQRHLVWFEQALQTRLWETTLGTHP